MKNNVMKSGLVVLSLVASAQVFAAPGTAVAPRSEGRPVESRSSEGLKPSESRGTEVIRSGAQGADAVRGSTGRESLRTLDSGSSLTTKGNVSKGLFGTNGGVMVNETKDMSTKASPEVKGLEAAYGSDIAKRVSALKGDVQSWTTYHLLAINKDKSDLALNKDAAEVIVMFSEKFNSTILGQGVKEQEDCWANFGSLATSNAKRIVVSARDVIRSASTDSQGLRAVGQAMKESLGKLTNREGKELDEAHEALKGNCRIFNANL